eukprot:COSAG01_NODE_14516_length_1444_cov_42.245353_2_plen_70_part_00
MTNNPFEWICQHNPVRLVARIAGAVGLLAAGACVVALQIGRGALNTPHACIAEWRVRVSATHEYQQLLI